MHLHSCISVLRAFMTSTFDASPFAQPNIQYEPSIKMWLGIS